jgi:type II secretory ATPase GspE/PulE/Tfp pilus assembly ATPase PilB-like protein
MLHGEAVVMRLLRQNATLRGMSDLGMNTRELEGFRRVLQMPHGIILVTGPTGSGKTSTLYTALHEINDSDRKIITIEDPVEYQLRGVNQIQVSEKAGLTFARGLRSILRHDPDVILIGEIRDAETAQIAVQASLTGHLVLATLHTNDSVGAVTRLVDMGVEPFLVASSLLGVLAQRLVRKLCPQCHVPHAPDAAESKLLGLEPNKGMLSRVYTPAGCEVCGYSGYQGRTGIFELLKVDEKLRGFIHDRSAEGTLRDHARSLGMTSLRDDGLRWVHAGMTSIEEVLRVSRE